jgi:hypothetical protein
MQYNKRRNLPFNCQRVLTVVTHEEHPVCIGVSVPNLMILRRTVFKCTLNKLKILWNRRLCEVEKWSSVCCRVLFEFHWRFCLLDFPSSHKTRSRSWQSKVVLSLVVSLANVHKDVKFEVFMAVTMKNAVFWYIKTQFVLHRKHFISATELSLLMLCKIWGFHGDCYEECRLFDIKPSSYLTRDNYINAIEPSRLMLCKSRGFHGGDYEECRTSVIWRLVALVWTDFWRNVSPSSGWQESSS